MTLQHSDYTFDGLIFLHDVSQTHILAFVPVCQPSFTFVDTQAAEGAGHIVTYRDLTVMSTGAHEPMFQDKTTYTTLVRVPDSSKDVGVAMVEVTAFTGRSS